MENVAYAENCVNPVLMEKDKQELVCMVYNADSLDELITKLRDAYGKVLMKKAIANTIGVNSGNIEKAKKILLQEAKRNGYDITPGNKEEISKITYDKDGFLISLSKRFEDKSAIEVSSEIKRERR